MTIGNDEEKQATLLEAVDNAIESVRVKLVAGDFKMTIAEFVRLLELEKELTTENIADVKVTWVNPFDETEPVSVQ